MRNTRLIIEPAHRKFVYKIKRLVDLEFYILMLGPPTGLSQPTLEIKYQLVSKPKARSSIKWTQHFTVAHRLNQAAFTDV